MALEDELLARMRKDLGELLSAARALIGHRQFRPATKLLGDGYKQLFGLDRRFLQMMDPPQVAALLGRPEKIVAFALLLAEEADVLRQQHDLESAAATARWTARVVEAARLRDSSEELRTLLSRLRVMAALA